MNVVPAGGGEVIGDAADRRVEILCEHDAVHVTWSRMAPGRDGADLHVHRRHHDLFYVLEGELTLKLGAGEESRAPAGSVVCVPPLVVHGFRNASDSRELRYLNFHAPGVGFADYMRGLRDGVKVVYDQEAPPATGTRPASEIRLGPPPLEIEAITVSERPGGGTSQRLEAYFVLDGELRVDGAIARPGAWVQIPPGVPHALSGDARFVHVSAG
jgi:quercetin dioxygenase-like cupin family protein